MARRCTEGIQQYGCAWIFITNISDLRGKKRLAYVKRDPRHQFGERCFCAAQLIRKKWSFFYSMYRSFKTSRFLRSFHLSVAPSKKKNLSGISEVGQQETHLTISRYAKLVPSIIYASGEKDFMSTDDSVLIPTLLFFKAPREKSNTRRGKRVQVRKIPNDVVVINDVFIRPQNSTSTIIRN